MARLAVLCYILFQYLITRILAEEVTITIPINDTVEGDVEELNKTAILRYGHHRTEPCQEFKKVYVCIIGCLDEGYHLARSDRNCKCTCFKDPAKEEFYNKTYKNWKIPTTYIPEWATKSTEFVNTTNYDDYDTDRPQDSTGNQEGDNTGGGGEDGGNPEEGGEPGTAENGDPAPDEEQPPEGEEPAPEGEEPAPEEGGDQPGEEPAPEEQPGEEPAPEEEPAET
ncbi:uncharacterized protein LOC142986788 [Anticarsia gemmatalis]|uniref:uncharacterized protein LOC142986788 n=1 Tax=Anticarsia gemmatalis TaxID=129554 RepID=UPI003F771E22